MESVESRNQNTEISITFVSLSMVLWSKRKKDKEPNNYIYLIFDTIL